MALKIVTPASDQPLTLVEAKSHCRVDHSSEDALITAMIKAATNHAEQFLGRALMLQTWDYYLDEFPASGSIKIPKPPLVSISGVFYLDAAGVEQTTDADLYEIDAASEPARVVTAYGESWPTPMEIANAVRIRFVAGYANAAAVPNDIKAAILLTIGTLYAHRETVMIGQSAMLVPWSAEQLLRPHRVHTAVA